MGKWCWVLLVVAVIALAGCRKKRAPEALSVVTPSPDAVLFDADRTSVAVNGTEMWSATYARDGHTARFTFRLDKSQPLASGSPLGFGHGSFFAVPLSDNAALLEALQTMLQAKHAPKQASRVSELAFTYADLGNGMSRLPDGGYTGKPRGHWRATKLFLHSPGSDEDQEVFFNVNPELHKGEFSIKDPDYGDGVLAQLARVL